MEIFNKGILEKCLKLYSEKMATLNLPLPEESLQEAHDRSRDEVMQVFDQQHFGRHHAKKSIMHLDEEVQKVFFWIFIVDWKHKISLAYWNSVSK